MATKKHNRFTPIFEGRTVRASVTAMNANVVTVQFAKLKNVNRAARAAKQGRMV